MLLCLAAHRAVCVEGGRGDALLARRRSRVGDGGLSVSPWLVGRFLALFHHP